MAYNLAIENAYVTADVIEIAEFPQLALKYGVMGVPLTIVNETVRIRGDVSVSTFMQQVISVMKGSPKSPDEPSSNSGISAGASVP